LLQATQKYLVVEMRNLVVTTTKKLLSKPEIEIQRRQSLIINCFTNDKQYGRKLMKAISLERQAQVKALIQQG
jgi:hypothetical protein